MKYVKHIFVFILLLAFKCGFSQQISEDTTVVVSFKFQDSILKASVYDSLIVFAEKYIGVKYKFNGTNKKGFDCSGFVQFVFAKDNMQLPHGSYLQALVGKKVDLNKLQKGDLVFFKGRNLNSTTIGHVGIVMEAKDGHFKMIHASVNKGVTIDYYPEGEYYKKRYLTARRIVF